MLILTLSPAADAASTPARTTLEIAPAGHLAKLLRVERIERDVDALDAAIDELMRKAGELGAVGGQGDLVERACGKMPGKPVEQRHHIAPDQRFAAGDADLSRAQANEGRAQPIELLERQHVALRQEIHVLGHAVDAAIIAAVGDRHAHIGNRAAEGVDERLDGGTRVSVHR